MCGRDADIACGRAWIGRAVANPTSAHLDNFGIARFADANADDKLFSREHIHQIKDIPQLRCEKRAVQPLDAVD
jgi:hypothetical protein